MEKKEHPYYKNFYLIPGMEKTYIEKNGIVYDDKKNQFLLIKMSAIYPYPCVTPSETGTDISVHRALALTFLDCPGDPKDYEVDHLNMDKLDWRLSNLQWTTKSENNRRAKSKFWNRPLLVKDLVTERVVAFRNIRECSKWLYTTASEIAYFLTNPKIAPWERRYDIIFEGNSWSCLTKADVDKVRRGLDREVVVKFLDREEIHIYPSMKLAAKALGVGRVTLYNRLWGKKNSKKTRTLTNCEVVYLNEFESDLRNAVRFDKEKLLFKDVKGSRGGKVKVTDLRTDQVQEFENLQAFSDSVEVKKNTVMKSMGVNNGLFRYYRIEYV